MKSRGRIRGTLHYVYAHWPAYFLAYGGIVLSFLAIALSTWAGWPSFIPLSLALLLLLTYFMIASLWAAHKLYGHDTLTPHHVLFDMAQIQSSDTFVFIDLGLRQRAIELGRRLTSGQILVVDVYSPQLTINKALIRWRRKMPMPSPDPRFEWRTSDIRLLPLPDQSVSTVILCQILSEFWQRGDRQLLLQEIYRILTPNGRLLMAERARSQVNWLIMGPAAFGLPSAEGWRTLLVESGFRLQEEHELHGLIRCYPAYRPTPAEAQQLALNLDL